MEEGMHIPEAAPLGFVQICAFLKPLSIVSYKFTSAAIALTIQHAASLNVFKLNQ